MRVPRPEGTKYAGKATVATLPDDSDDVCIIWEELAPRPFCGGRFVVTPMVPRSNDEREDTVKRDQLSPLLDFETSSGSDETEMSIWKEQGDNLLRLGDASSAIPFYEAGLEASSKLEVGCAVLLLQNDRYQVAEVDCLEDSNVDVTIGDEEATVPASDVKLCLLPGHELLQVRTLLNLTRCLMQLGDLDGTQMAAYYRRAAAKSCSMALAIFEALNESDEQLHVTALLLRSRAYASRSKWALAMQDAKAVVADHPSYKEGQVWLSQLEKELLRQKKSNKKLAKSMCQWVQTATAQTETTARPQNPSQSRGDASPPNYGRSVSRVQIKEESSFASPLKCSQPSWILVCQMLLPLLLVLWTRHQITSQSNSKDR